MFSKNVQNSYSQKEGKGALVNHNALISRFHNYVNQHQMPTQQQQQMIPSSANQFFGMGGSSTNNNPNVSQTPQKQYGKGTAQTPQQMIDIAQGSASYQQIQMHKNSIFTQSVDQASLPGGLAHSAQNMKQSSRQSSNNNAHGQNQNANGNNGQTNKSLLPPKVAHRRQSSYGGSSSNVNTYLGNIQQQTSSQTGQSQNPNGSGGIFNKIFGSTFNRNSGLNNNGIFGPGVAGLNLQNQTYQEPEISPFNAMQSATIDLTKPKSSNAAGGVQDLHSQQLVAFQTFDHPRQQTTSRTTSNTQYQQNAPPLLGFSQNQQQTNSAVFMKGLLSHTNKKTNDVDIFLPYQI